MSAIILTTQTTTPLSTAQISGTDGATSSSSAQPQVSAWSLFGQNKATARQNKGNLIDIFDLPTTSTYEDVIGYFRDEFGISDSNIPQAIPYWSNYIAKIKSDPLSNIASDLDQLATLLQIIPGINNQKTSGLLNGTGFDVSDLTEELQAQANTLNIFEFMKFCSEQIGVLNEQRLKQKVKNADITYKQVDNINKEMIKQNKDRIEKETETLKKQDEQKTIGIILGVFGIIGSILATICTLGSGVSVAVAIISILGGICATISTSISLVAQYGTDEQKENLKKGLLGDKDKSLQALEYAFLGLGILLSVGSGVTAWRQAAKGAQIAIKFSIKVQKITKLMAGITGLSEAALGVYKGVQAEKIAELQGETAHVKKTLTNLEAYQALLSSLEKGQDDSDDLSQKINKILAEIMRTLAVLASALASK